MGNAPTFLSTALLTRETDLSLLRFSTNPPCMHGDHLKKGGWERTRTLREKDKFQGKWTSRIKSLLQIFLQVLLKISVSLAHQMWSKINLKTETRILVCVAMVEQLSYTTLVHPIHPPFPSCRPRMELTGRKDLPRLGAGGRRRKAEKDGGGGGGGGEASLLYIPHTSHASDLWRGRDWIFKKGGDLS